MYLCNQSHLMPPKSLLSFLPFCFFRLSVKFLLFLVCKWQFSFSIFPFLTAHSNDYYLALKKFFGGLFQGTRLKKSNQNSQRPSNHTFLKAQLTPLPTTPTALIHNTRISDLTFLFCFNQVTSTWARKDTVCLKREQFRSHCSTLWARLSRCLLSSMTCRTCLQILKHSSGREPSICHQVLSWVFIHNYTVGIWKPSIPNEKLFEILWRSDFKWFGFIRLFCGLATWGWVNKWMKQW